MARLSASYQYADGDKISVTLKIENDYPDALDEARKVCADTLRDLIALAVVEIEDEG